MRVRLSPLRWGCNISTYQYGPSELWTWRQAWVSTCAEEHTMLHTHVHHAPRGVPRGPDRVQDTCNPSMRALPRPRLGSPFQRAVRCASLTEVPSQVRVRFTPVCGQSRRSHHVVHGLPFFRTVSRAPENSACSLEPSRMARCPCTLCLTQVLSRSRRNTLRTRRYSVGWTIIVGTS